MTARISRPVPRGARSALWVLSAVVGASVSTGVAEGAQLFAGAARVDITDDDAGPANDRLYARALVVRENATTVVIVAVDAVAIGEIGPIGNDFLPGVRERLEAELGIPPAHVIVNASHCHGIVSPDVGERTVRAVRSAAESLAPVTAGAGVGHEDRIMENRRLRLKSGREVDVRHAYSLPPDDEVVAVGPVDTEIGVLRLDRMDGRTLAVLYNFACHPIQGVPGGGNTADITGFSSKTIEDNLGDGAVALFLQGCGGDINPIGYKDVDHVRSAEPLGLMLGLSTLRAVRAIECEPGGPLTLHHEVIELPRADLASRITAMEAEREALVDSLDGVFLDLKTFLSLAVKHGLAKDFPSSSAYRYLHEEAMEREGLERMDARQRSDMAAYARNVRTMEKITRINTNLVLLRKHQRSGPAAGNRTIEVELVGLRIGDFVLTTFPGELTVRIGLAIKEASPHDLTFVAGYTNGYIYYAPTAEQLRNAGGAQEDSDCLLAPAWQELYEARAGEIIRRLLD